MVQLTDKAKQMGETTSFSASDAADALKYMAMAGWETNAMLAGIEPVLNLAQAGALDLGTTSDIVTDAMTAFGMTVSGTQEEITKDVTHFTDVLAVTTSKANTDVAMLGETFKKVAPLAGALNFTVDDVSVGLGLMANSGIKGSSAGIQLRSALANLADPTQEVSTAMQTLGISLTDSAGEMKPFSQTLNEMRTAFAGLSEAEKSQYASTIAGKQGMSGFLAMMNASDKEVEKLTKAIQECDGAAKQMAETMTDNLEGDLAALGSKFEALQLQVFDVIEPLARLGTQTLTNNVIPAIMDTIRPMSDLMAYMKAVRQQADEGGHIEEFLPKSVTTDLATLESRAKMLQSVLNNCKTAWNNFKEGFKSSGALQAVKQAINDVYDSVLKVSRAFSREAVGGARSFGESLGNIVKWIAQAVSGFANLNASTNGLVSKLALGGLAFSKLTGGFSGLLPVANGIWGKISSGFVSSMQKIGGKIASLPLFESLKTKAQSALAPIKKIPSLLTTALKPVGNLLKAPLGMLKNLSSLMLSPFKKVSSFITGAFKGIPSMLSGLFKNGPSMLSGLFKNFPATISGLVKNIPSMLSNVMQSVGSHLTGFMGKIKSIPSLFSNMAGSIGSHLMNIVGKVKNIPSLLSGMAGSVGTHLMSLIGKVKT
ncbi:MAG: phage tail tape measure protein, partial [Allobaculum sp.]|nr:phage tail tape measure protein [Allobaculum sp.]